MPGHKKPSVVTNDPFESVFLSYSKGLLVYAQNFLSSREESEDIVSDVFINLLDKIDTIAKDAVKPYLFSSTRNRCLNYLAHMKIRSEYQEKMLKEETVPYDSPDLFVEAELRNYLNAAIDKLPPQKRKIFIMNKIEKKSYAEIAEELNLSIKTVDKHLELSYKMLRSYLPRDWRL